MVRTGGPLSGRREWRVLLAALVLSAGAVLAVGMNNEGGAHRESTEHRDVPEGQVAGGEAGSSSERIFSVDLESPFVVGSALLASLLLAGLALWRPSNRLYFAIALVMAGFAVGDGIELVRQANESNPGIALRALLAGGLHLGAAGVAGLCQRLQPSSAPTA